MTATLPYRWYTDAEVLARERELLIAPAWHYAGHLGELAEPGSYFTCRAGDVPIVVVRDRAGALSALVNVCRHRGAEVVSGAGRCTTLQCHYHAWTYGLDGELRAAPRANGLDRGELGLRRAAVETWGPFVFVNAAEDPPTLSATLGPLPEIVERGGLDVDALVFHHRAHYALDANWKVAVENFLECYHCAVAHPGFSDVIDVDDDAYRLESHPTFASHYARVRAHPRAEHYDASGIDGQFHLVWPSLKVNVMPGRPNISIGPLTPVAPARTEGVLDYFFAADEDPSWIADYLALDDQVGAEDRVLVESVQRGMASGAFARGELLLPSESLIAEFQRWVADGLQTPSRGKVSVQERE
jgi:phenylpropionate dioxygenase-like ring-hydroxylating dioxygenase large terminal subunit